MQSFTVDTVGDIVIQKRPKLTTFFGKKKSSSEPTPPTRCLGFLSTHDDSTMPLSSDGHFDSILLHNPVSGSLKTCRSHPTFKECQDVAQVAVASDGSLLAYTQKRSAKGQTTLELYVTHSRSGQMHSIGIPSASNGMEANLHVPALGQFVMVATSTSLMILHFRLDALRCLAQISLLPSATMASDKNATIAWVPLRSSPDDAFIYLREILRVADTCSTLPMHVDLPDAITRGFVHVQPSAHDISGGLIAVTWDPYLAVSATLVGRKVIYTSRDGSAKQTSALLPLSSPSALMWTCDGHFVIVFDATTSMMCLLHRCGDCVTVRLLQCLHGARHQGHIGKASDTLLPQTPSDAPVLSLKPGGQWHCALGPRNSLCVFDGYQLLLLRVHLPSRIMLALPKGPSRLCHIASHPGLARTLSVLMPFPDFELENFFIHFIQPLVWITAGVNPHAALRFFEVCTSQYVKKALKEKLSPVDVASALTHAETLFSMYTSKCLPVGDTQVNATSAWKILSSACSHTVDSYRINASAHVSIPSILSKAIVTSTPLKQPLFQKCCNGKDFFAMLRLQYVTNPYVVQTVIGSTAKLVTKDIPALLNLVAFGLYLTGQYGDMTPIHVLQHYATIPQEGSTPHVWAAVPTARYRTFPSRIVLIDYLAEDCDRILHLIEEVAHTIGCGSEAILLSAHTGQWESVRGCPRSLSNERKEVVVKGLSGLILTAFSLCRTLLLPCGSMKTSNSAISKVSTLLDCVRLAESLTPWVKGAGSLTLYFRELSQKTGGGRASSTIFRTVHDEFLCPAVFCAISHLFLHLGADLPSLLLSYKKQREIPCNDHAVQLFRVYCRLVWWAHCGNEIETRLEAIKVALDASAESRRGTGQTVSVGDTPERIDRSSEIGQHCLWVAYFACSLLSYGTDSFVPEDLMFEAALRAMWNLPFTQDAQLFFQAYLHGDLRGRIVEMDGEVQRLHTRLKARFGHAQGETVSIKRDSSVVGVTCLDETTHGPGGMDLQRAVVAWDWRLENDQQYWDFLSEYFQSFQLSSSLTAQTGQNTVKAPILSQLLSIPSNVQFSRGCYPTIEAARDPPKVEEKEPSIVSAPATTAAPPSELLKDAPAPTAATVTIVDGALTVTSPTRAHRTEVVADRPTISNTVVSSTPEIPQASMAPKPQTMQSEAVKAPPPMPLLQIPSRPSYEITSAPAMIPPQAPGTVPIVAPASIFLDPYSTPATTNMAPNDTATQQRLSVPREKKCGHRDRHQRKQKAKPALNPQQLIGQQDEPPLRVLTLRGKGAPDGDVLTNPIKLVHPSLMSAEKEAFGESTKMLLQIPLEGGTYPFQPSTMSQAKKAFGDPTKTFLQIPPGPPPPLITQSQTMAPPPLLQPPPQNVSEKEPTHFVVDVPPMVPPPLRYDAPQDVVGKVTPSGMGPDPKKTLEDQASSPIQQKKTLEDQASSPIGRAAPNVSMNLLASSPTTSLIYGPAQAVKEPVLRSQAIDKKEPVLTKDEELAFQRHVQILRANIGSPLQTSQKLSTSAPPVIGGTDTVISPKAPRPSAALQAPPIPTAVQLPAGETPSLDALQQFMSEILKEHSRFNATQTDAVLQQQRALMTMIEKQQEREKLTNTVNGTETREFLKRREENLRQLEVLKIEALEMERRQVRLVADRMTTLTALPAPTVPPLTTASGAQTQSCFTVPNEVQTVHSQKVSTATDARPLSPIIGPSLPQDIPLETKTAMPMNTLSPKMKFLSVENVEQIPCEEMRYTPNKEQVAVDLLRGELVLMDERYRKTVLAADQLDVQLTSSRNALEQGRTRQQAHVIDVWKDRATIIEAQMRQHRENPGNIQQQKEDVSTQGWTVVETTIQKEQEVLHFTPENLHLPQSGANLEKASLPSQPREGHKVTVSRVNSKVKRQDSPQKLTAQKCGNPTQSSSPQGLSEKPVRSTSVPPMTPEGPIEKKRVKITVTSPERNRNARVNTHETNLTPWKPPPLKTSGDTPPRTPQKDAAEVAASRLTTADTLRMMDIVMGCHQKAEKVPMKKKVKLSPPEVTAPPVRSSSAKILTARKPSPPPLKTGDVPERFRMYAPVEKSAEKRARSTSSHVTAPTSLDNSIVGVKNMSTSGAPHGPLDRNAFDAIYKSNVEPRQRKMLDTHFQKRVEIFQQLVK